MARGLKVWAKKPSMLIPLIFFNPYLVTYRLYFHLCLGRWKCIHPAPASPVSNYGKHNERADERCGLPFCWDSLSTGKVGSIRMGNSWLLFCCLSLTCEVGSTNWCAKLHIHFATVFTFLSQNTSWWLIIDLSWCYMLNICITVLHALVLYLSW